MLLAVSETAPKLGSAKERVTGVWGVITSINVTDPVPPAPVALIVTLELAAVVGVPEINPVAVLIVNPAGYHHNVMHSVTVVAA